MGGHIYPGLRPGLLCGALTGLAGSPIPLCLFVWKKSKRLKVVYVWRGCFALLTTGSPATLLSKRSSRQSERRERQDDQ